MKEMLEIFIIGFALLTSLSLMGLIVHYKCEERRSEIKGYVIRGIIGLSLGLALLLFVH